MKVPDASEVFLYFYDIKFVESLIAENLNVVRTYGNGMQIALVVQLIIMAWTVVMFLE